LKLRATEGELSYNAGVTPEELWRAVGEVLLLHRTRKKWKPFDVERHGGPTYKTVQAIERGDIGRVDMLAQHAEALGLSIVDVLRSALDRSSAPLSPEAAQIVRKFERATVEGRQALLALAQALPDAPLEGPVEPHPPPLGRTGKGPRKS
jgi:hypothetical protein